MEGAQVTVALSDGTEEVFAPGLGGVPEAPADRYWPVVVRYIVDPSGALLVGYGMGTRPPDEAISASLGEFGVGPLTIVKTFAPGRWTSVSGGNHHWRSGGV